MRRFACMMAAAAILAGCASTPRQAEPAQKPSTAEREQPEQAASVQKAEPAREAAIQPGPSSLISAEALGIYRTPEERQEPPSNDELAVIASAKTLLGKPPNASVIVNGKGFTLDCIGTVSAIYWALSLDVTKDFSLYPGNGVNRLYMTLKERNALHTDAYPRPGDVIIWDNTWDADEDGDRIHDPRTHAGIVLAVDADGTVHYVHENLYKGIVVETMNLLRPTVARDEQGKVINSGLAIATKTGGPKPEHSLSGDVFNCFGDVLGSKYYFFMDLARELESEAAAIALRSAP
jgi:hypothetical protein